MTSPRVIYFGIRPQKSAAEVGGWSKVDQMGLKGALTYDTATQKYHNYPESQVPSLIESLQTADLIVGFNQLNFDYKILSIYTDTNLGTLPNFDMLSKIEQTLNFRVSRDNLVHNTLDKPQNGKSRSTLENRVNITKSLFAHGCKEGYLSYHNSRFGKKEVCDTSNWADTARSITEKKQLPDPIVTPDEPESPQSTVEPRMPSEFRKEESLSELITTPPTKLPPELSQSSRTTRLDFVGRLSPKEYLSARYLRERISTKSVGEQIPEEALQIYCDARKHHHHPALYTYKRVANLLGPNISFQEFNVGIVRLWRDHNRHEGNAKDGSPRYYYYFDRSGTLACERVNDYIDIRNIKEELARGI